MRRAIPAYRLTKVYRQHLAQRRIIAASATRVVRASWSSIMSANMVGGDFQFNESCRVVTTQSLTSCSSFVHRLVGKQAGPLIRQAVRAPMISLSFSIVSRINGSWALS
jgi:hypothetical protein